MFLSFLKDFLTNPLFLSAAAGWLLSQGSKIIYRSVKNHGISMKIVTSSGGMPSSHTATVSGLLFATLFRCGAAGFEFPMALFFAIVVIYDALNVRYQASLHGRALNYLSEHELKDDSWFREQKKYDEHLGHTLPEVIVGFFIGLAAAILIHLAVK
ncbi:MAG: divergent PAP2 family protein [Lachnospiraceae bacterium]|jgi:acid phosphatase family membrane protein YuiD